MNAWVKSGATQCHPFWKSKRQTKMPFTVMHLQWKWSPEYMLKQATRSFESITTTFKNSMK